MRIAIIGAGSVGATLGQAWIRHGEDVTWGLRNPADPKYASLPKQRVKGAEEAVKDAVGVAITTTSASLTASSAPLTRCLGNDAYFGSAGLRSPQVTSSPCLIQACPSVAPTEPAPMMAIRMHASGVRLITNQALSARRQQRETKKAWRQEPDPLANVDDCPVLPRQIMTKMAS